MWTTEPEGKDGPVRSIWKNNVLPGSGPTDLHFGKNGIVPKYTIRRALDGDFLIKRYKV